MTFSLTMTDKYRKVQDKLFKKKFQTQKVQLPKTSNRNGHDHRRNKHRSREQSDSMLTGGSVVPLAFAVEPNYMFNKVWPSYIQ